MSPRAETHCLRDILREPGELRRCLDNLLESGRPAFERAAATLQGATEVYIAGIGASWAAGMAAQSFFQQSGRPATLVDASELMHQPSFRRGSAIVILSRSGKSIEVVTLLDRAREAGAKVIGVTNAPESPLGQRSDAVLHLGIGFDHAISVVTYSTVALGGALVSAAATGQLHAADLEALRGALGALPAAIAAWRGRLAGNAWFAADKATYFLARQAGLASAHESRLLWEETAKAPASALSSGGFRHGAQEIVEPGLRFGIWLDGKLRREEDIAMARDLRKLGARVMLIGQGAPAEAGDLVFELPPVPPAWQFVTDIIPAQLAAEHLAGLRGVDCDSFRLGAHVVLKEGGLL